MPAGAKFGGRDWKKGESGNPSGKPPVPLHLRQFKRLTAEHVSRVISKYAGHTLKELVELTDPKNPKALEVQVFDAMVLSILRKVVMDGDVKAMEFILARTIGPIATKPVQDEGELIDKENKEQLKKASSQQLKDLLEKARAIEVEAK